MSEKKKGTGFWELGSCVSTPLRDLDSSLWNGSGVMPVVLQSWELLLHRLSLAAGEHSELSTLGMYYNWDLIVDQKRLSTLRAAFLRSLRGEYRAAEMIWNELQSNLITGSKRQVW